MSYLYFPFLLGLCRDTIIPWYSMYRTSESKSLIHINQGVTKRCRLYWLTKSAHVNETKCGGDGECYGVSANEYSCALGFQINFGDLTPYLIYSMISPDSLLPPTSQHPPPSKVRHLITQNNILVIFWGLPQWRYFNQHSLSNKR
jgi:hypothetical protein